MSEDWKDQIPWHQAPDWARWIVFNDEGLAHEKPAWIWLERRPVLNGGAWFKRPEHDWMFVDGFDPGGVDPAESLVSRPPSRLHTHLKSISISLSWLRGQLTESPDSVFKSMFDKGMDNAGPSKLRKTLAEKPVGATASMIRGDIDDGLKRSSDRLLIGMVKEHLKDKGAAEKLDAASLADFSDEHKRLIGLVDEFRSMFLWHLIDVRYSFVAADQDGLVYAYEHRPDVHFDAWGCSGGCRVLPMMITDKRLLAEWQLMLAERPHD